jgi:hypothetical protein
MTLLSSSARHENERETSGNSDANLQRELADQAQRVSRLHDEPEYRTHRCVAPQRAEENDDGALDSFASKSARKTRVHAGDHDNLRRGALGRRWIMTLGVVAVGSQCIVDDGHCASSQGQPLEKH